MIVDGQGGHAAAGADALLTGDHGGLGGHDHVADGLGAGGGGVVGGDVDHVAGSAGGGGDGSDIVGVGKSKLLAGVALLFQHGLDRVDLVLGVRLGGAVEQAHGLGVGEQLIEHGGLLVQGGQVGGAGDVGAGGAGPVVDAQCRAIVGDGSAQDRDVRRAGLGGLEGSRGVGQDQVHAGGHEAIDDGSAVGGLAGGVLHVKGDGAAVGLDQFRQLVLEALGGGVQRGVLHQLADAHGVGAGGAIAVCLAVSGGCVSGSVAAAGGQAHGHDTSQQGCKQFLFHVG